MAPTAHKETIAVDNQTLAATLIGAGTGLLASMLTALGLRDRIDKIERSLVGNDTFKVACSGLADRIIAVQADLNHQIESMRSAAIAAENSAQAARVAAERAVELARQYVEYREQEAKAWRVQMDAKMDQLIKDYGHKARK